MFAVNADPQSSSWVSHRMVQPILNQILNQILTQIRSGSVWMVKGTRRDALILHKPHLAELVMFSSAVGLGLDQDCLGVTVLGEPQLIEPSTPLERRWAHRRRQRCFRWQQRILEGATPQYRAQLLIQELSQYWDPAAIADLPDSLLAQLAGVHPERIVAARQQF